MTQYGKKMDATIFLTLSEGRLGEPVYVCNSPEAVQRDDDLFLPLHFAVYLDKRLSPFPGFNITDIEHLICRFNDSVITAPIELTQNDIS